MVEIGPNEWLVEEMYDRYKADPASVGPSWQAFFADYCWSAFELRGSRRQRRGSIPASVAQRSGAERYAIGTHRDLEPRTGVD